MRKCTRLSQTANYGVSMTTITIVHSLWRHNDNCCYATMRSQGQVFCLLTLEFKCHLRTCGTVLVVPKRSTCLSVILPCLPYSTNTLFKASLWTFMFQKVNIIIYIWSPNLVICVMSKLVVVPNCSIPDIKKTLDLYWAGGPVNMWKIQFYWSSTSFTRPILSEYLFFSFFF